jgi:excinuclease ABC subunit C
MYFGPYTSATLLRRALAVMRKIFPLRTCRTMPKTACLNYHIGQCAAPCIKKISGVEYGQIVEDVILFLKAKRNELLENLSKRMADLAGKKMFEEAGRIRDQIQALTAVRFNKPYSIKKRRAVASGIVELKSVLGLDKLPIRIEAFDISDISGKEAVGSMVSFLNGKPDKSNYRRFRIKTVFAVDDYKMMQEVIRRRYKRLLRENAQLPDMIIIDGGKGHVSAAKAVLDELHLNKVKLFGIAKKLDKIFSSKGEERITDGLRQVIQHIRDEAHRFAQNYHHVLRRKKIIGK